MIALVLAMVWSRRGQAVTLALLALFAVAAAVAAPAYLAAADRAVASGQVAAATMAERSLTVASVQSPSDDSDAGIDFTDVGAALTTLPGFTYVYSTEFLAIGIEKSPRYADRMPGHRR